MWQYLTTIYRWIIAGLIHRTDTDVSPETTPELEAELELKVAELEAELKPETDRWKFDRKDVEQDGTFYFRRAILDELDDYFKIIQRMKRVDKQAYDLYKNVGATITPREMLTDCKELPVIWHTSQTRPTFGAVSFCGRRESKHEGADLKFLYFEKMEKRPSDVQPFSGDAYRVTVYLDQSDQTKIDKLPKYFKKEGLGFYFFVGIDADGKMHTLKTLQYKAGDRSNKHTKKYVNGKKYHVANNRGGANHNPPPARVWDLPRALRHFWKEDHDEKRHFTSAEHYATETLTWAANFALASESGIRVEVRDKSDCAAVFCVDQKRTAYFFKDRETVVNDHGSTKRIFHIVRPHRRVRKNGQESFVKMHYRGLRKFTWNDYQVLVTVPGLHHNPLVSMTGGSLYQEDNDPLPDGMLTTEEFSTRVAAVIRSH